MNNPTLQTQQFLEAGPFRRMGEAQLQEAQMAMQAPGMVAQGADTYARMLNAQSNFALDEVKRQDAMQQLQFARELHTTDMVQAQRDAAMAQSQLAVAQARKATRDLSSDRDLPDAMSSMDRMALSILNGVAFEMQNGRWVPRNVRDEEKQWAAQYREAAMQRMRNTGTGRVRSPEEEAAYVGKLQAETAAEQARARKYNSDAAFNEGIGNNRPPRQGSVLHPEAAGTSTNPAPVQPPDWTTDITSESVARNVDFRPMAAGIENVNPNIARVTGANIPAMLANSPRVLAALQAAVDSADAKARAAGLSDENRAKNRQAAIDATIMAFASSPVILGEIVRSLGASSFNPR